MTDLEREASEIVRDIEDACERAADYAGTNPLGAPERDGFEARIVALAQTVRHDEARQALASSAGGRRST